MKCQQKKAYKTFGQAWKDCVIMLNRFGFNNTPYLCKECGNYHTTSKYNLNGKLRYEFWQKKKAERLARRLARPRRIKIRSEYYWCQIPIRKMRFWERWKTKLFGKNVIKL